MPAGNFGLSDEMARLYGVKGRLPAAERLHKKQSAEPESGSPYGKWKPPSGDSRAKLSSLKPPRKGRPRTMAQIAEMASPKGGYPRKLVTSWGVPWPLVSGWKKRLIRGDYD